ncbi:MAG: hypothetical protein IM631_19405 [Cytophagales bacterium]|jgi:hypothetical protein|nr:hypothetical protein [Cytophagales bacterium]MCA6373542.1 hypothetical protein [Cytophagales bacterium]MCA6377766.1 hypothetical protein [Cytophagales bacterium]MCA6385878.1 hypothetical protein [Cytophagales bacterium]
MARLKKDHKAAIDAFSKQRGVLKTLSDFLAENNLGDFEIESVKFRPKEAPKPVCKKNYHLEEVCKNGKCEWKCVPD